MVTFKKFLLLVIPCCLIATQVLTQEPKESTDMWMIIFVHGTSGATSNISLSNIYRIMLDEVENSSYEKAVDLIRSNPYMYQNQPMQEYGLHPVDHVSRKPGQAAALFAHIYDAVLQETFPQHKYTAYYTYGWSGVLSESIRYKNATRFYQELLKNAVLIKEFSPYKNKDKQFAEDVIMQTGGPFLGRELFSRERNGYIIKTFKLKDN